MMPRSGFYNQEVQCQNLHSEVWNLKCTICTPELKIKDEEESKSKIKISRFQISDSMFNIVYCIFQTANS
jgi:hypothetical protein